MKHLVLLPHPNASKMSSRQLVAAITFIERSNQDRSNTGKVVPVVDIIQKVLTNIYFRQQCINVLRSRMKRRFDKDIIDRLALRDPEFAQTFCEKHLGCPLSRQTELALSC